MNLRRARVAAFHQRGQRLDAELGAIGDTVLQGAEVWRDQLQSGLGDLEVKQLVAQSQIKQLGLPLRQAAFGGVLGGNLDGSQKRRIERREVRHRLNVVRRACVIDVSDLRQGRPTGKWFDLNAAGHEDVDPEKELVLVLQMLQTTFERDAQGRTMAVMKGDSSRFEGEKLAACDALADFLGVLNKWLAERDLMKPYAHPGMSLLDEHHWAQAGLLKA